MSLDAADCQMRSSSSASSASSSDKPADIEPPRLPGPLTYLRRTGKHSLQASGSSPPARFNPSQSAGNQAACSSCSPLYWFEIPCTTRIVAIFSVPPHYPINLSLSQKRLSRARRMGTSNPRGGAAYCSDLLIASDREAGRNCHRPTVRSNAAQHAQRSQISLRSGRYYSSCPLRQMVDHVRQPTPLPH